MSKIKKHQNKVIAITCNASEASKVFLAGSFNQWNPESTPMKRRGKGPWEARLELAPGRYEFKFIVDGQWCCEPGCESEHRGCPKCVSNTHGTMNRVLEVG